MPTQTLNGDEAFAYGALEAGVKLVAGYPGSPSSGTLETLLSLTAADEVYIEWSTNEKVALEVGIGTSLCGYRALVCVKSVGMNVLVDPLMVLNLTGVRAGLVVLLGDDPGAYGSQNDQDTRPLASYAEVPLLEPSTPKEAKAMMVEAFNLSEKFGTVVLLRETRSFSQSTEAVDVSSGPTKRPRMPMLRESLRWAPYPGNAVAMHRGLHEKLERVRGWSNQSTFNVTHGNGRRGVIGVGFVFQKLLDLVGDANADRRLLKLGTIFPVPDQVVAKFLGTCNEVLVLEENEPYVETQIKALAYEKGLKTRILGKLTEHVSREGELFRWQIRQALERFLPGFTPQRSFTEATEASERPSRKDNCAGCRFLEIVETLKDVGDEINQLPILVGDPGCLVKASHLLDAKYAMGSAVAIAQGMVQSGAKERVVAIFGDSSFFHTSIPALINSVYNKAPILMLILDNSATVTSGFQPNPGTGKDPRGRDAPRLIIEKIAEACGVDFVRRVAEGESEKKLRAIFKEGLTSDKLGLIVVQSSCRRSE